MSKADLPPPSEIAFEFPAELIADDRNGRPWPVTVKFDAILSQAYPEVNLLGEYRKAVAWLAANPSKRKTSRGMKRFLNHWMNSASKTVEREWGRDEFERLAELVSSGEIRTVRRGGVELVVQMSTLPRHAGEIALLNARGDPVAYASKWNWREFEWGSA